MGGSGVGVLNGCMVFNEMFEKLNGDCKPGVAVDSLAYLEF
jgi:hypothetical protein